MTSIRELTKLSNGKELDIKYPIVLKDNDGKGVYYEASNGHWWKDEFDKDGNKVYSEGKTGFWEKREYRDGIQVYYEDSNGFLLDNRKEIEP